MITNDHSSRRFLCGPSLSLPITGVAMAPTRRLIVSIHCAALTLTCISFAMDGTKSIPSELTTAVQSAA